MFPLTFDEYIDMKAFLGKSISQDITEEFDTYLREGGFPKAIQYDSTEDRRTYIKGIVTAIQQALDALENLNATSFFVATILNTLMFNRV